MAVDKAFVVELVVDMLVVVGEYRLVGFGPVLGIVSCEDALGLTVGRVCVYVGPIDTGLNLGVGPG